MLTDVRCLAEFVLTRKGSVFNTVSVENAQTNRLTNHTRNTVHDYLIASASSLPCRHCDVPRGAVASTSPALRPPRGICFICVSPSTFVLALCFEGGRRPGPGRQWRLQVGVDPALPWTPAVICLRSASSHSSSQ
ncbi:hypothetical protein ACOMHN_060082 [Nucella lapillus]